jgi:ankyrin repeat protein
MKIPCSSCNQRLEIPEELAGQTIECPACNASLTVPTPEPASPPIPQVQVTPPQAAIPQVPAPKRKTASAPKTASLKQSKSLIPKLAIAAIVGLMIVGVLIFSSMQNEPSQLSEKDSGLINSARIGDIGAVKKYLANGANINARNELGETSLHAAAFNNRINIVQLLLDNGSKINSEDNNGYTPIDMARGEVSVLLGKRGGKGNYRTEPITEATQPEPPIVKAPEISIQPEPPTAKALDISIHKAAREGNIEAVKQHLAAGADVNVKDNMVRTPLHRASTRGHKEIVELLITKGADVNVKDNDGFNPLLGAVIGDYKEVVILLIAKGADVNITALGETPLDWAIIGGENEIADLLRKHGGKHGTIHGAARGGDIEAVKEFLAAGADVNAKDDVGETPLDWAIGKNRTEVADLLRKHGGKTGEELKAEGK